MAHGNFVLDKGKDVATGATITKFRAVKLTTNDEEVTSIAANTDIVFGFAQFGVTTTEAGKGKGASVRVIGITEAEASAAINEGQWCTLEADGRVSPLVGASGKTVVGMCVGSPAANAGDRISLWILPQLAKA